MQYDQVNQRRAVVTVGVAVAILSGGAAAAQDICQQQRVEHNEPEPFLNLAAT